MNEIVYIYESSRSAETFLRAYFQRHNQYDAVFYSNARTLKHDIKKTPPRALLIGSPECLDRMEGHIDGCPTIAMLADDITQGMKAVVKNAIEHYVIPPYFDEDLDYKLTMSSKRSTYIDVLVQEKQDLSAIADLTYLLSSTLDPEEVLFLIVKKISDLMPVSRCSILSVGFKESKSAKVVTTFENPSIKDLTIDLDKYPEIQKAVKTKRTVVVKDALNDPLMQAVHEAMESMGIKSIVVVPIIFRTEVIGTLFLRTSSKDHTFTEREIKLCQGIANASANALNNAFLFQEIRSERAELEKLAITDFLTGIYNIRYLYHRLEEEFSRAARYHSPLSCLMLDIDFFKRINDTYGHRTGDIVLRDFAQIIKEHTRRSDVFARYGGEEFILLLPEADVQGAKTEAERIGRVVKTHRFKDTDPDMQITVSIGVACYPDHKMESSDELIHLADKALLKAKVTGRDKVVIAE